MGIPGATPANFVQLTYLPSTFVAGQYFPNNAPGWTLFYELVLNAIYVVILARMPTRRLLQIIGVDGYRIGGLRDWRLQNRRSDDHTRFFECVSTFTGAFPHRNLPVSDQYPTPLQWLVRSSRPSRSNHGFAYLPERVRLVAFSLVVAPALLIGALEFESRLGTLLDKLSYPLCAVHFPIAVFGFDLGCSPVVLAISAAMIVATIICIQERKGKFSILTFYRS